MKRQLEKYEGSFEAADLLKITLPKSKSPMKKCLRFARLPVFIGNNFCSNPILKENFVCQFTKIDL